METKKLTALDVALKGLKRNPNADFQSLKKKAAAKKLVLIPIVYGRARHMLGMAKRKPKVAKTTRKYTKRAVKMTPINDPTKLFTDKIRSLVERSNDFDAFLADIAKTIAKYA